MPLQFGIKEFKDSQQWRHNTYFGRGSLRSQDWEHLTKEFFWEYETTPRTQESNELDWEFTTGAELGW